MDDHEHDMSGEGLPTPPANGIPTKPQQNYRAKYILSGHTMAISSVKFSPTGAVLASAGACVLSSNR